MLAYLLFFQQPDITKLDELAKNRDAAALTSYLVTVPKHNPFNILQTGGAYAAGQRGWSAKSFTSPDGANFVVFSTPIIEEDMGELLFQVTPEGKLSYIRESDNMGVELDHHDFDLRFDLAGAKLIATDQVDCHWAVDMTRPPSHFVFRISPTFTLRSLTDLNGKAVPFSQAGGIIAVAPKSTTLKFIAKYDGTTFMPGFDRQISDKEATLCGAVWYLTIARHPAPYDATIHCQKDWTALAQGDLVSTSIEGEEKITKFHNPLPVVWYGATAGPYKTVVDKINGKEFAVMSSFMTDEQMHDQNLFNSEVVAFYSKSFMPYPFKRWTSLDSWQFHGGPGALEAYSFATYPGGLPGQDSHEPSHTWWGGILDNDYLQSLWNESFADYCQGLFARNRRSENAAEFRQAFVSPQFANPAYNVAPLSDSGAEIGPAAAALGYGKGADVLQMLEDEIGTDTMIKCMKTWITTNPSRHIGRWEDFEKVVNQVSGKDMTWFFDQWVRRPGYVDMTLIDARFVDGRPEGHILGGRRPGVDCFVKFNGQPYQINVDVLLQTKDGKSILTRALIKPNQNGVCQFTVPANRQPVLISIDPWGKILRPRTDDETAPSIDGSLFQFKTFASSAEPNFLAKLRIRNALTSMPDDLSNTFVIGSPETLAAIKPLCDKAGFHVAGGKLTYDGTTVDLSHGGAIALIDLPSGGRCMIGLGTCKYRPEMGNARLVVFDEYGRPLRTKTDPITTGKLAKQIG